MQTTIDDDVNSSTLKKINNTHNFIDSKLYHPCLFSQQKNLIFSYSSILKKKKRQPNFSGILMWIGFGFPEANILTDLDPQSTEKIRFVELS